MTDTYFVFFFYNLGLECDDAYEVGENLFGMLITLEMCCVISVRLDSLPVWRKHQ